jgi:hypothetical protein
LIVKRLADVLPQHDCTGRGTIGMWLKQLDSLSVPSWDEIAFDDSFAFAKLVAQWHCCIAPAIIMSNVT